MDLYGNKSNSIYPSGSIWATILLVQKFSFIKRKELSTLSFSKPSKKNNIDRNSKRSFVTRANDKSDRCFFSPSGDTSRRHFRHPPFPEVSLFSHIAGLLVE
ncbi:hypothetical protein CEXT_97701 [Caerostris extrusa]|uniref:Uncharacterized protein n=1 Tax=Caerostris extrusa TaxID=172846 RepID=A0AAV4XSC7_CAEEX|nr:hypothetical protein CEXT_97701 [Caerostris extrusa]